MAMTPWQAQHLAAQIFKKPVQAPNYSFSPHKNMGEHPICAEFWTYTDFGWLSSQFCWFNAHAWQHLQSQSQVAVKWLSEPKKFKAESPGQTGHALTMIMTMADSVWFWPFLKLFLVLSIVERWQELDQGSIDSVASFNGMVEDWYTI